jgi:hypothetical protein
MIKHHWLENQVLNKSADDVAFLWHNVGWRALTEEFPAQMKLAEALAQDLTNVFSPAQLVDALPCLASLATEQKRNIRDAVHQAYLDSSELTQPKQALIAEVARLNAAIQLFINLWAQPRGATLETKIRTTWDSVLLHARATHEILDSLPRDVILI